MRVKKLQDPIFYRAIFVIVSTPDELKKWVSDLPTTDCDDIDDAHLSDGMVFECTKRSGKRYFVLWVRSNIKGKHLENVLDHEQFHLTHSLLQYCGIKFSDDSEEAYAFYHAYLAPKIRAFVYERKATGSK